MAVIKSFLFTVDVVEKLKYISSRDNSSQIEILKKLIKMKYIETFPKKINSDR